MCDFTTIATYPQSLVAHAARNFLKEHGIRAVVGDEFTTDQSWSNYIEAKLQVVTVDVERAKLLLESVK